MNGTNFTSRVLQRFRALRVEALALGSVPRERRRRSLFFVALAAIFVTLRITLILRCPTQLYHPEEYIHLRLFRQLQAGLPLGDLAAYSYGAGTGYDGGGALVQSLLYLPLCPIIGTGHFAVKTMALIWAVLGACLAAAIARRLFGERGEVMALVAFLALPPAYLIFSTIAWATHTEGAVLMLLLMWVYLSVAGPPSKTHYRAQTAALGFILLLAPWFSPPTLLPALLLATSIPWVFRGRYSSHLPWIIAGGALGILPGLLIDLPGGHADLGTELRNASAMLVERVHSAGGLHLFLFHASSRIGTYHASWPGHWSPTGDLAGLMHGWCCALGWLGAIVLLCKAVSPGRLTRRIRNEVAPRARRGSPDLSPAARVVLGTIPLTAIGMAFVLHALDLAEARRLTPIYPLWALGWASLLVSSWRVRGRLRIPARFVSITVPLLAAIPCFLLVVTGDPPSRPFRPSTFALEPKAQPVQEWWVAMFDVSERTMPTLNQLVDDPRLNTPSRLGAALRGYNSGSAKARDPLFLDEGYCPLEIPPEFSRRWRWDEDARPLAWEYFGAGLAVGCPPEEVARGCEAAETDLLRVACLDGSETTYRPPSNR